MTDDIDDDVIVNSNVPSFEFSPEDIARIRADAGVTDVPPATDPILIDQPIRRPRNRRRGPGRPRAKNPDGSFKYPRPGEDTEVTDSGPEDSAASPLPPAPLTKRDEREVATRLANILTGATGMAGVVKPYLQMTDDEAKAIADPLSSYLVRNADSIPVARAVLENYDLLAITLGVMAYLIRVYRDRSDELSERRKQAGPAGKALSRLEQLREASEQGQANGIPFSVSTPYGEGNGFQS